MQPVAGKRVLDVGCGGGILSEATAALGAEVTGIDTGQAPLAVAKLHLGKSGLSVDYQHATAEEFSVTHPNDFDVVTCLELLEHVPDPASVEIHPASEHYSEGYEVEFFAGNGETIAVVSVPAKALRAATRQDILHVRRLSAA